MFTELQDAFAALEDEPVTEAAKGMVQFTVMRGYATRLAEADEAPVGVVDMASDPYEAAADLVLEQQAWDDPNFWSYFAPGEKVWRPLATGWTRVVNAMLIEESPEEPTFPDEPIDHLMRMGYLGALVDQAFGLSPIRREAHTH